MGNGHVLHSLGGLTLDPGPTHWVDTVGVGIRADLIDGHVIEHLDSVEPPNPDTEGESETWIDDACGSCGCLRTKTFHNGHVRTTSVALDPE